MGFLAQQDEDRVRSLTCRLTGSDGINESAFRLIIKNITKCMHSTSSESLSDYLQIALADDLEFARLISAVTIHHTAWFREYQHYRFLETWLNGMLSSFEGEELHLRVFCAACSTGEEVYSLAFLLESFMHFSTRLSYQILAQDIDPLSVARASVGRYSSQSLGRIPLKYRKYLNLTSDTPGYFTVRSEISEKITFKTGNLLSRFPLSSEKYDLIFCRNVFVYMSQAKQEFLVKKIANCMKKGGLFFSGLSEHISSSHAGFTALDNSVHHFVESNSLTRSSDDYTMSLSEAVKALNRLLPLDAVLIGASTGGFEALKILLSGIGQPEKFPPVLVVQHIAEEYLASFSSRLAQEVGLIAREPFEHCPLTKGSLYMAHGDYHLNIRGSGSALSIKIDRGTGVDDHRPGIDNLFYSAAKLNGFRFAAFLLTGMGHDGAKGLLALKNTGAFTCIQDRYSSVVFGMPKAALSLNAACYIGNINSLHLLACEITKNLR